MQQHKLATAPKQTTKTVNPTNPNTQTQNHKPSHYQQTQAHTSTVKQPQLNMQLITKQAPQTINPSH